MCSIEEELVHRTPARDGQTPGGKGCNHTDLSTDKKEGVPGGEAGHRTQHPEPCIEDVAFYLKSSEKLMKVTLGGR